MRGSFGGRDHKVRCSFAYKIGSGNHSYHAKQHDGGADGRYSQGRFPIGSPFTEAEQQKEEEIGDEAQTKPFLQSQSGQEDFVNWSTGWRRSDDLISGKFQICFNIRITRGEVLCSEKIRDGFSGSVHSEIGVAEIEINRRGAIAGCNEGFVAFGSGLIVVFLIQFIRRVEFHILCIDVGNGDADQEYR